MLYPVILSGGSGTRLWPLSRPALPKQMLPLVSNNTLLQETLLRLRGLDVAAPLVVCNAEQRFLVAEQLRAIDCAPQSIMLEPSGRNTAPALAVAALQLTDEASNALMLVLAADHVILDVPGFHAAIQKAISAARQGHLATFGVVPHKPETGYGYIQRGAVLPGHADVYAVARFVEKPDLATAQTFVASGDYLWNSGMFLLSAARYLEELERLQPEMMAACRAALDGAARDEDFCRLEAATFQSAPSLSIDYAVMEKTNRAALVPVDIGWSDVGSWSALWEVNAKDEAGNVVKGKVALLEARDCYVQSTSRAVAAIGVRDLVIVETADAVLVAHRDHVQDVKKIAERLSRAAEPSG